MICGSRCSCEVPLSYLSAQLLASLIKRPWFSKALIVCHASGAASATHEAMHEMPGSGCTRVEVMTCAAWPGQRHTTTIMCSQRIALLLIHAQLWSVTNTSTSRYLAWAEADAGTTTLGVSISPCAVPAAHNQLLAMIVVCIPLAHTP